MTKWSLIKEFFRSPKRVFTRRELKLYVEKHDFIFYDLCTFDRYRAALRNAGYLKSSNGVYTKIKTIPHSLTLSAVSVLEKENIKRRRL